MANKNKAGNGLKNANSGGAAKDAAAATKNAEDAANNQPDPVRFTFKVLADEFYHNGVKHLAGEVFESATALHEHFGKILEEIK